MFLILEKLNFTGLPRNETQSVISLPEKSVTEKAISRIVIICEPPNGRLIKESA